MFYGGNTNTTIYDIAGMARVSMATVSRVLNNPDKVNSKTKDKVLKIIDELGYVPNPVARELASKRIKPIICLIVSNVAHTHVPHIINGILSKTCKLNLSLRISLINKNLKDFIDYLLGEKYNGFILISDEKEKQNFEEIKFLLEKNEVPIKLLNSELEITEIESYNLGIETILDLYKKI